MPDEQKLQKAMSPVAVTPSQQALNTVEQYYKNPSLVDPILNANWDGSANDRKTQKEAVEDYLLKHGTQLKQEETREFKEKVDKFHTADKQYEASKDEFADTVRDSTLLPVSFVVPQMRLAPLLLTGTTVGSAYGLGLERLVKGPQYANAGAEVWQKDAYRSASAVTLNLFGPKNVGLGREVMTVSQATNFSVKSFLQTEAKLGAEAMYTNTVSGIGAEIVNPYEKQETLGIRLSNTAIGSSIGMIPMHLGFRGMAHGSHFGSGLLNRAFGRDIGSGEPTELLLQPEVVVQPKPEVAAPISEQVAETPVKTEAKMPQTVESQPVVVETTTKENEMLRDLFKEDRASSTAAKENLAQKKQPFEPPKSPEWKKGSVTLDGQNRITQIKDKDGIVTAKLRYAPLGDTINATKIEFKDGSQWLSENGYEWTEYTITGEKQLGTFYGRVTANKDGTLQVSNDGQQRLTYPDGTMKILYEDMNRASVELNKQGQTINFTNAEGQAFRVVHKPGSLDIYQLEGANGEVFQFNSAVNRQERYIHIQPGKPKEFLKGVYVDNEGNIILEKDNFTTRHLDGSVTTIDSHRGKILERANLEIEKSRLLNFHIHSSDKQNRLRNAVSAYEATCERLGSTAEGGKTLHEINEMLNCGESYIMPEERAIIATQILENAANPYSIQQGYHNSCNVGVVSVGLYARDPALAANIMKQAVNTGEVTLPNGSKIKLRQEDLNMEQESFHEALKRMQGVSTSKRRHADQIMQNILANTYIQLEEIKGLPPGTIRYEQHPRDQSISSSDTGERLVNTKTGEFLKDEDGKIISSPGLTTPNLETIYKRITGKDTPFILMHDAHGMGTDEMKLRTRGQVYKNEAEFKAAIDHFKPSETNPLVLIVTCQSEPFFKDSGRWLKDPSEAAGGSSGYHVISITGYTIKDGKTYVNLDNTWDIEAQHKATVNDTGEPVLLDRLYLSTLPTLTEKRNHELKAAAAEDPLMKLDYLRERRYAQEKLTEAEANSTKDNAIQLKVKKLQKLEPLGDEKYYEELGIFRNELMTKQYPSYVSKEEIAYIKALVSRELGGNSDGEAELAKVADPIKVAEQNKKLSDIAAKRRNKTQNPN
jgi:hypothetical protein